jgi:hypothetical protein
LQVYVQCQVISIVETRRAEKETGNAHDSVAKCQEGTATLCDAELRIVHEMQWLKKAFN